MSAPSTSPSASLGFAHRFVPAAAGAAAVAGTLLLLHGTGGDENDMLPIGRAVATPEGSWNLLSPRGLVLENGMPRFFRRLAEGVFDEADLIRRASELADFVGAAARHYEFNAQHVVALGYSNGANIAAAVLLLRPRTLAGAVLLRAMVPLKPEKLPALTGTPVLLSVGRHDPIVPGANTEQLAALLRGCGAEVTLAWNETGHGLTNGDLEMTRRWLQECKSR